MTKAIRPIRIEGNLAFVPLTRGYEAVIDAADVALVAAWNWHAMTDRSTVYAGCNVDIGGKRRTIRLHRIILAAPDGMEVDHIDSNGLNCRRANMRLATPSQNQQNARISRANTSGVKGVTWNLRAAKWRAQIMLDGKQHNLGVFANIEDAAAAYASASADLHGEFGRTA